MDKAAKSKLLNNKSSKLAKKTTDLMAMMRDEESWRSLSPEARERLIQLLPAPMAGEEVVDKNMHPLKGPLREYIEAAITQWKADLGDGRETKKFREHRITTVAADLPFESDDVDEEQDEEMSEYEEKAGKRKKK